MTYPHNEHLQAAVCHGEFDTLIVLLHCQDENRLRGLEQSGTHASLPIVPLLPK